VGITVAIVPVIVCVKLGLRLNDTCGTFKEENPEKPAELKVQGVLAEVFG
jgi:hypothetical protein